MMQKIAVIGVPSSAGARQEGQELAPGFFRGVGLIETLRAAQLEVIDLGDLPLEVFRPDPQHPKQQNLPRVRKVAEQTAEKISKALSEHAKPVILGGDCSITFGVLAGLISHYPNLGLMYFDGDVDLNTPDVTLSGIFDGMVLAHVIGEGEETLSRFGPRYPLMSQSDIILFGYNTEAGWIDEYEVQRLQRSPLVGYTAAQIRGNARETAGKALAELEQRTDQILVHFDVDVIDKNDFPVADVPHEHGLSFDESIEALTVFMSSPKVVGLVVTEFNAYEDPDKKHAKRLVDALGKVMGKRISVG